MKSASTYRTYVRTVGVVGDLNHTLVHSEKRDILAETRNYDVEDCGRLTTTSPTNAEGVHPPLLTSRVVASAHHNHWDPS
jgi:hypothetical protein